MIYIFDITKVKFIILQDIQALLIELNEPFIFSFLIFVYFIFQIQFFIPLLLPFFIFHLSYDLSSSFFPLFLFRKWKVSQGYQQHGISSCSKLNTSPCVKNGQV